MTLIRIALPVPLARYFDYLLPSNTTTCIGARVIVPFGSQQKVGIVVGFPTETEVSIKKLKPIISILDKKTCFTAEIWQLLQWAAQYYHAPLGEVLHSALPVKLRQGESFTRKQINYFKITTAGQHALAKGELTRAKKQHQLLTTLANFTTFFEKPTACSPSVWAALIEKQYVEAVEVPFQPISWQTALADKPLCNRQNCLTLNKAQTLAVSRLSYAKGFNAFLLNGVTGSGKTEVYLQIIETVLMRNEQVLVLVPEIGLTPQTIRRFKARFNVEIDILHSNLNDTQRMTVWLRAKQGESAIVIGTRSALFTQFKQLGLIIIDEEHDSSFKQQDGWRYHARDLALVRAKNNHIPIILGSATPSLESFYNVKQGKFEELVLDYRAGHAQFSTEQLIDLKKQRIFSGLSEQLLSRMQFHLEKGNQIILFLNRRGFAPVLLCHECGWICQCHECDKPFTYYQKNRILRCHHCNTQSVVPRQCEHCGSTHLITTGIGTEQLEAVLQQRFPQYRITRIDRDSTTKKGELERHLAEIQSGKSQILIGTQMLAKGHHFPNVTLVGLVNVDASLFSTDFRAEERLAQLYIQVSGRAGRSEKAGEVLLQTHYPDHPLLTSLLQKGYREFAEQALVMRQTMQLPPFSAQVLFRATGKDNDKVTHFLHDVSHCLQKIIVEKAFSEIQLLGPFNAPMAKKGGYYRCQLLVQHRSRICLQQLLNEFDHHKDNFLRNDIRLTVDIDPQDLG